MEPTNLQVFVAEVKGTGESEYMGVYKQVPLRLRADIFCGGRSISGNDG